MQFITYRSFQTGFSTFSENVSQLLIDIPDKKRVLTICIFGKVTDDKYLFNLSIIQKQAEKVFGRLPLISYIAQSPENEDDLIAEAGYLSDGIPVESVNYHEIPDGRYLTINTQKFSALMIEGIIAGNFSQSIANQSQDVFSRIQKILETECMRIENIVRQWNYIGHITAVENGKQNYQEFNDERARFYNQTTWKNGFPAATGISMDIHAVIVSLIAVQFHDKTKVFPLNNSLQLAAHCYSEKVLANSTKKETPKFERAKLLISNQSALCFISGTAAILGEKSMEENNVSNQTLQTISLINHLISSENLKENGIEFSGELKLVHLRVYVKNAADFKGVRQIVESELPGINVFYVCAPVCRDELLVEIEGIAVTES
jgi:enamine deaminase RidA (YjgF/YER057c/UK114 family)